MAKKLSPFEQAYANARSEGLLEFEFEGEKYHTRQKEESPAAWHRAMRAAAEKRMGKAPAETKRTIIKPMKPQEDLEEEELSSWRSGNKAGGKVRYAK